MERHLIILAFVEALERRPGDFCFGEFGRHRLVDGATGHEWWVANEAYGFKLDRPYEVLFAGSDRRRAWRAYQRWLRNIGDGEGHRRIFRDIDLANEAVRAA